MTGPPLSPGQLAIWYEEQLRTGFSNTGYFAATIAGDLAEEVVARACRAIVGRHPALRTLVAVTGGRPALSPRPADAGIAYEMVPLPCPPGGERAAVRAWRATSGKLAFDLTAEPPIAFTLLRHGPGRRTLLVVVHHICFDGRSKFVFAREFTGALRALSAGLPFDPPPVPSPSWPGESAELIGEAAGYWAGIVPDCPPLVLPLAEHPSGAAPSAAASLGAAPSAAASLRAAPSAPACLRAAPEFTVGAEQRRRLAGLAADGGTTLFGGLLAVLAAQLHAYGNERAVLSVPVDVSTAGTRDLIGPAVNVVPVALDLPRAATFRSLLAASAAAGATIKRYRRVPFRELAAGRPWSAGARALFAQLSLSWLRLPAELPEVPGLDVAWDFVAPNTAPTFACAIQARDAGDHLVLRFDHAGASLDSAAADEMAALFRETTAAVLAAPDRPLSGPDR
ncbi:condensation domain-containing protein, partial [Actinoplanes digitatis]